MPKAYASFYHGDWDGAAWIYNYFDQCWNDPARGSVPIGWVRKTLDFFPCLFQACLGKLCFHMETQPPERYFLRASTARSHGGSPQPLLSRTQQQRPTTHSLWWGETASFSCFVLFYPEPALANERSDRKAHRKGACFLRRVTQAPGTWTPMGSSNRERQVHILPNSWYPARTHSHSLIAYGVFG